MKKRLITLLSALVCASANAGVFWDGNRLYNKLTGDSGDRMQALGYIMGVSDAVDAILVCAPANATAGQLNDMVKQYLDQYPSIRHLAADSIVTRALERVWPCEKKSNRGGAL